MMFFGAVSVMSTPPHGPPPPAPTRGQRGGTVTWWDIGPASAKAAAANASIRDVLPMLRTENWEPPGEPFGEWHPLKRGNVYQAGLLATTDSVSTEGNKEFASGAASPALAAEKDQVDSRSPRMTKTPTPRGRRGSLEGLTPVHYVLEIQPSLEEAANFTFNGTVTITFACRTRTDKVAVHAAAGLAVDVLSIAAAFRSAQKPLRVENASRSALQDLYLVRLREQLHRNVRYNLTLRFAGTVGTEPKGLYRVSYADAHSKGLRWALLTRMRPKYARRVFPCFDDPSVTASFDITIVHRKGVNALSNMPVYRTERRTSELVADTFARTPKIPTLLIAFTLNNFPSFGKGTMRVWTRASATHLAQKLALDIVPKLLEHYEDYYETKYPMPKLDVVLLANCSTLTSGYFGLIFAKEPTFVLQNPRKAVAKDAVRRLSSLARAISAQWFGNHVTLSGWNNLWLGRAMAELHKYAALHKVDSYWNTLDLELVYDVHEAMYLDSLGTRYALSDEASIDANTENPLVNVNLKKASRIFFFVRFSYDDRDAKRCANGLSSR
ncbi:aminopeptidase N-like isoform X2 [Haemaphysalis longicornis]